MAEGNGFAAFMSFMDNAESTNDGATDSTAKSSSEPVDEYAYEEEQEREAMMKSYHHPMKQWFRQQPQLVETHGQFPLFWQDLKAWAPYREVLKKYLQKTDGRGTDGASGAAAIASNSTEGEADPATNTVPTTETDVATSTPSSTGDRSAPTAAATDSGAAGANANANTSESVEAAPKRRKKSRWGDAVDVSTPSGDANGEARRKKSRWAPAGAPPPVPAFVARLTQQQQQSVAMRTRLEQINRKLQTVSVDAARMEKDPSRSPSPPPQYDANGKRTNTREVRMRTALEKERRTVIDEMVKVNPNFRPPADYVRQKLSRKIYIPVNDFPNYNFIGLIIGPRGNTQKRMEKDSNCKIAIRGKGSVKEGSRGKKSTADENDDLHVLITGDREEDLDRAAKDVQSLLVPVDDTRNEHKQKQLRELALINGTLRDDDFCHLCGEKGHRQWECPNREKTFKTVAVKCAICGDSSHPTRDCTQRGKSAAENAEIDKEYQSFMQQLGEKPIISTATKTAESAAPWLQNSKPSASTSHNPVQPWEPQQTSGAPIVVEPTQSYATQHGPPALGSTPATAYPPPVIPAGPPATAYAYPPHAQAWNQWGSGYYYGTWDQSGGGTGEQAAVGTEYQYAQYDPNAVAASTMVTTDGGAGQTGVVPGTEHAYQYQAYQTQPPQ